MPVFLRVRLAAIRLARALRRSILTERKLWEIDTDRFDRPCLVAGPFRLVIEPRAVRLFDAIHVYCGGAEIWLPLISRLRIRNAVRMVLVENALEMLESADMAESNTRRKTAAKRSRAGQLT